MSNTTESTPAPILRRGWTTGTCAAAACRAAYRALKGQSTQSVAVKLKFGWSKPIPITSLSQVPPKTGPGLTNVQASARVSVIKDAGDDPDCTHGATVWVELTPSMRPGLKFHAGDGVGTVCRAGLPLAIGEPAINPGPRKMIEDNLIHEGWCPPSPAGWDVIIGVIGGEYLAQNTWNPRLGIEGGLSILGTTGIVIPYSCSAWLASIKLGLAVATTANVRHFGAATGKTSMQWLEQHGFSDTQIIDMGDFVLGTCKQLRRHHANQWSSLHVAGGVAKLCKLAQGNGDLHNSRSVVKRSLINSWLEHDGAPKHILKVIRDHTSIAESMLVYPRLGPIVAEHAVRQVRNWLPGDNLVSVSVIDRGGRMVAQATNPQA